MLWALICFVVALVYGIQFDKRFQEREDWLGDCWQNFEELVIQRKLSQEQVEQIQAGLNPSRSDNFPGASTTASTWLVSLVQSIILSLIIWQPLTVYITTYIKLWMFTWNIGMGLGPSKIIQLLKHCCGCDDKNENEKQLSDEMKKEMENLSKGIGNVVAHTSRPLDLIGFLGNDALFLDRIDANQIGKDNNNEEIEIENKQNDVELVTMNNNTNNKVKDKEQVLSESEQPTDIETAIDIEEGDGITEINVTKGGPKQSEKEANRESNAVLNYDEIFSDDEDSVFVV